MNNVTISLGKILMCGVPLLVNDTEKAKEIYRNLGKGKITELNVSQSDVYEIISRGLSLDSDAIIVENLHLLNDDAQQNLAKCLRVSDVRFKQKFIFQSDEFKKIAPVLSRELYKYKFIKINFFDLMFSRSLPIKT